MSVLCLAASNAAGADDPGAAKGVSRFVQLERPGDAGPMRCEVVQVLDSSGEPSEYFMDVDTLVDTDAKRKTQKVRLHFDPLGNYQKYELLDGGNLTKAGRKGFTPADHEQLHQILSDPYSPLKSITWDQITVPQGSAAGRVRFDAISAPTMLSKQSTVVVGAAYTCCTLWHWSHGEVGNAIREMTVRASDKQDWLRYLRSDDDPFVVFAVDQLRAQRAFDPETIRAVVEVMRRGSLRQFDPALAYLAEASKETGVDHFFRCCEDECLANDSDKRVRFLEALRETDQKLPPGYLKHFEGWLTRANSHYEVHLLLTLFEREEKPSDTIVGEALNLLENRNALIVRRSYQYLKARDLSEPQQKQLQAFEQQHPNGW